MQKGRMKGDAKRGATISFGSYALKALENHWITDRQIEAARRARRTRRKAKTAARIEFENKSFAFDAFKRKVDDSRHAAFAVAVA